MAHQVPHVCHSVVVQPQSPGNSIEHLIRRIVFSALLKPQVIVGANTSKYRDLFPAQTVDSTTPTRGQTNIGGLDQTPTRAQKLRQGTSLGQNS
jgi:hypothetical protein